jgi:hypothetical protein
VLNSIPQVLGQGQESSMQSSKESEILENQRQERPLAKTVAAQASYFPHEWCIPGTAWRVSSHSGAMERTGVFIGSINIMLDAGVDLPLMSGKMPTGILVTHGHINHMNALPMLLRHKLPQHHATHVFAPATLIHRLRQFCQLSWAVKVGIESELPIAYALPLDTKSTRMPIPGGQKLSDHGIMVWR